MSDPIFATGSTLATEPTPVVGRRVHRVTDGDTARRWGNDLPVLATPVLLWLGEITAMDAIEGRLAPGEMTVGLAHDSRHLAPTLVGRDVEIVAHLRAVEGRTLVFDLEGRDGDTVVLAGTHTRAVVDAARFVARLG